MQTALDSFHWEYTDKLDALVFFPILDRIIQYGNGRQKKVYI